ncbi:hypothetical protein ACFQ3S_10315 [Mucilaginibacter terrae]|uniref:hypothetical protein n=1 Tax=Mucilaginibacter terrae TaxID=1955052 RepID=UPI0036333EB8
MKGIITFIIISCCTVGVLGQSQQAQLQKILSRKVPCLFEGNTIKLDTALYADSRSVSYSYSYYYPKYFKEIWPKEEVIGEVRKKTDTYIDTVTYVSPDQQAQFKIFAGQVVPFPLGTKRQLKAADVMSVEKAVDDYIKIIKAGKDKELGKVKTTFVGKGINGYNFSICVKAWKGQTQYLYKIIVAELPATGELIFSHFLYQYNAAVKAKYEALGNTLANGFNAD